ncbi:MAG: phytoene/squalene synthase family protein, partial [Steroidobacteraceae bacterium]|nr:phytoene/squalene synthase family protein [Steroidobacteraceae bacterium]
YAACARTTRREARNFYYGFASLPRRQRLAIYALYAFCREADDCVDSASSMDALFTPEKSEKPALLLGDAPADVPSDPRLGIARLRERLAAAADGHPLTSGDLALADAIERFGVSPDDLADVITGVEMDLTRTRYATFDDLRDYCYHVASAVGLATLPILNAGVPPTDAMREHAIDLGLGMQLINVLRDVAEDLERDRVYLPQEDLVRFGVDQAALVRREMTEPLRLLLAFQAARAVECLDRGRRLLPHLPRRGRACPWLLAEIYGRVLQRLIRADYDVFAARVSVSKWAKLGLLVSARWRA